MTNYKYARNLKKIGKDDLPLVGGKGANLGEMIRAELPVPDGFVILTSAYKRYIVENKLEEKIEKIIRNLNPDNSDRIKEVSQTIQKWLKKCELPDDIKKEIAAHYKKIDGSVAVRSSATAEDLPGSSFAGQYDTYLNIRGLDNLYAAVKNGFASLWNERAISYRLKQDISHGELAHAVVVQKLIDSEKAGILFTANPMNGSKDQMVINASWGLGEAIVSGDVSPDQWIVEKNSEEIIEERISKKEFMTVREKEGTNTREVTEDLQNKSSLSEEEIIRLIKLGTKTESYFDSPQDIEWGIENDKVYILQSRNITTLEDTEKIDDYFVWNSSKKGDYLWTNNMIGDIFPEVMTPGTWSVWSIIMGKEIAGVPAFSTIGGRIYANYSFLYSMMRRLGKNHEQTENLLESLVGPSPDNIDIPVVQISFKTILLEIIPYQLDKLWKRRKFKRNFGDVTDVPEISRKLHQQIEKAQDEKKLISLWSEKIRPLFISLYYLQDKYNDSFFKPYANLKNKLKELIGEEKTDILLTNASGGSEELASIGPILDILKVSNGKMSREEYIKLYGHRHYNENELSVPRPKENEDWFDKQLAEFHETAGSIREMMNKRSTEFNDLWKEIESDYPRKAKSLKEKIKKIRVTMHIRENVRSELTRSVGVIRKFYLRAGELTDLGEDIFFLTYQDVLDLLSGDLSSMEYISLRKKKYEGYQRLPSYPQFIKGEFEPFQWAANSNRRSDIYASDILNSAEAEDDGIKGCAASAGYVEGVVRRIDSPEEGDLLQRGEILVTATTNIGWTPIFSKAAAVITDVGAQLSHAAIVAREMGIPAVVGTGKATTYLKTGDRVIVDGAKGIVRVLNEE